MSKYLDMSIDQINALPPAERVRAKDERAAHRERVRLQDREPAPTAAELLVVDMRLGLLTDYSETPVFVKDNYGAYMDPKTGKRVARNSRKSREVMEMPERRIDGGSSRQDNAMNRFLQGDGVDAEREAKKWRFIMQQTWQKIKAICVRHEMSEFLSLVESRSFEDERYKEYSKRAYKLRVLKSTGEDYKGDPKAVDREGRRIATSLGYLIESFFEAGSKLREANDRLDHAVALPKRKVD